MSNICAIVVTYNRIEKLKKALCSYEKQILKPKYLIVVNNASTDNTAEYLEEWCRVECGFKKIVLNLESNLGGSGGFYEGQKYAMQLDDVEWIMLGDDDAYPEVNYLSETMCFENFGYKREEISVVCGLVEQYGHFDNLHRAKLKPSVLTKFCRKLENTDLNKSTIDIGLVSYVGPIINIEKLKNVGLTKKEYFIWMDDYEHSIRLSKVGKIICITNTKILHDVEEVADKRASVLDWKFYYGVRNKIDLFKNHLKKYYCMGLFINIVYAIICPILGKPFIESKLRLIAIKDGVLGNLGKHPVFKPGWKL